MIWNLSEGQINKLSRKEFKMIPNKELMPTYSKNLTIQTKNNNKKIMDR